MALDRVIDVDIKKLRKLLISTKNEKFANMLSGSRSFLNVSNTFGSKLFSLRSIFEIHSPLDHYEELMKLNYAEKATILKYVLVIYPLKDHEPEVCDIEFFPDVNLIPDYSFVEPEKLLDINFDFIQEQITKCKEKIDQNDYDGAITNARSLVETICLLILEKTSGQEIKSDGDLPGLFKKVSLLLQMDGSLYDDKNLKKIISGAFNIVTGIAAIRNTHSDSHGRSSIGKYKLSRRHAILVVNLSKTISDYIYSSWEEKLKNK